MKDKIKGVTDEYSKILLKWLPIGAILVVVLGLITSATITALGNAMYNGSFGLTGEDMPAVFSPSFLLYGLCEVVIIAFANVIYGNGSAFKASRRMLGGGAERVEGALENSRWMEDQERDELFPRTTFSKLKDLKKDGIPLFAVYNSKKKDMDINIISPAHGIIIGATGSGKTTTFVNPVVQILGRAKAGSSMICTDPKGE
nr:hypothetical protein [Lachnospiraceae bacterium]